MEKEVELTVSPREINSRLDLFLAHHLGISRSFAARLVENGNVSVDGVKKRPSLKLKAHSKVKVHYHQKKEQDDVLIEPCAIALDVLYEDSSIIVINKPAGLVVHPGAGNKEQTLVHALLARYPEIAGVGDPSRPGIVHRLDKLTSGVLVIARNPDAHAYLSLAFKSHEHLREYLAVCYGHMPEKQGSIRTFMQRHPRDRKRMTSRVAAGREAITHYQVLREWKDLSLIQLRLETGRTHQIRVHLSDMGHPIVGDAQYGGKRRVQSIQDERVRAYIKSLNRQMLHAAVLGLKHPLKGVWMEFRKDMPDDMLQLLRLLDGLSSS